MIAPVTGPEVIAGSTRLKAGTAQKMVLNMLSTGTMIKLGKTFGNLMVDVKASNAKLRERAIRIVQEATDLPHELAAEALEAANGETKTAIVAVLGRSAGQDEARDDDLGSDTARSAPRWERLPHVRNRTGGVRGRWRRHQDPGIVLDRDGVELGRAVTGPSNYVSG